MTLNGNTDLHSLYEYCVFDITNCNTIAAYKSQNSKRSIPFGNSLYDFMSSENIYHLVSHLKSFTQIPMFVSTDCGIALALPHLVPSTGFGILLFPSFGGDRLLRIYRHMKWDAVFGEGTMDKPTRMSAISAQYLPLAEIIRELIDDAFGGLTEPEATFDMRGDVTALLKERIAAISRFVGIHAETFCRDPLEVNGQFDFPVFSSVTFMMATLALCVNSKNSLNIRLAMNNHEIEEGIGFSIPSSDLKFTPAFKAVKRMVDRKRIDLLSFGESEASYFRLYPTIKDWAVLGIKQPDPEKGKKMSRIHNSASELIGKTPLLRLNNIEKLHGLDASLIAKLEYLNPAGSVKDRAALAMINAAERSGQLVSGSVIIEPTSGNTGIGLCSVAATRGYKVIIVMPDTMSEERRRIMKAYGAELVLTDGGLGMKGAIEKAEALARSIPGSFVPDQFNNFENARAHFETTGPEIWEDTDGQVDIFVAGVGTGGTVTGVGEFLKSKNPDIKIIAVEPASSPLLSERRSGAHKIQGIGANFVPSVLNTVIYDEVIAVEDGKAMEMAREVGTNEGVLVGISSGAALAAGVELSKRPENKGKNIVVLLPDTGDRYLSTELFSN